MSQQFGELLDPYRTLKEPLGIKGNRQSVVINNNPSTIDQNQTLTVRFPNLGKHDVIVPGTARLAFNVELESDADPNRTVVPNLGRSIIQNITVKIEGREVLSLNEANIFLNYCDLWLTENQRKDRIYQGIQAANGLKHRINAGDKTDNSKDKTVASIFKNRFCVPLEFELLNTHLPFYPGALSERLSYELRFNRYDQVVLTSDPEAKYKISNISLEFDLVNHIELARMVLNRYQSQLPIYYQRVLHHSTQSKNKSDTIWNFSFSTTGRSIKGVLMLFKEKNEPFQHEPEKFFNPKINHLTCTIEGSPNQIYANGLLPYHHFEEARKFFGCVDQTKAGQICKDFHLHDLRLEDFYMKKYGLWLDLRTTDDNKLHGSGRRIEGSDGLVIQIEKEAGSNKEMNVYIFVVYDAQLNIAENRLKDIVF